MEADFGDRLDYLTDEMCQMNTRVGHIARRQARLCGFAPSHLLLQRLRQMRMMMWMRVRIMLALSVMAR